MDKVTLTFPQITGRIREIDFPEVDIVVGIANGGTVPACLVAFHLECPIQLVPVSYRDAQNHPIYPQPRGVEFSQERLDGLRVLLVDDVSVSGKTLAFAKGRLQANHVTTFVLKGDADIVAFPEITACVNWPWFIHSITS